MDSPPLESKKVIGPKCFIEYYRPTNQKLDMSEASALLTAVFVLFEVLNSGIQCKR